MRGSARAMLGLGMRGGGGRGAGLVLGVAVALGASASATAQTSQALKAFGGERRPYGGLARDSAGSLYGTTRGGNGLGFGTVFKIDSGGTHSILLSFNYTGDLNTTAFPIVP